MKLIEKFLYYSVGFASETAEELTKLMQKLIEQDKICEEEAGAFLNEYAQKMDEMTEKFDQKLENFIQEYINSKSYVRKAEIEKLEQRIERINQLLDKAISEKSQ